VNARGILISVLLAVALLPGTQCSSPVEPPLAPQRADFGEARKRMIDDQIRARGVANPRVLEAMTLVPRHEFVPEEFRASAYDDHPLPTSQGQTISQPYIVALMTELADPKPEHRVLEIGTGSGYQAAVLSGLVQDVYTIELLPELARTAAERLQRLGYKNVHVRDGDGYLGWPEHAPFDSILVTAGATEIPKPLVEQLKPGGRMIIPVGDTSSVQMLQIVEKDMNGDVRVRDSIPVRFVPLLRK
jgi:protein-L-isoaspartate(D-aspartate) O-methyltransferase